MVYTVVSLAMVITHAKGIMQTKLAQVYIIYNNATFSVLWREQLTTIDLSLDSLAEVVFIKFLQCEVTPFLIPILCFLEGSHCIQPILNEQRIVYNLFNIIINHIPKPTYPLASVWDVIYNVSWHVKLPDPGLQEWDFIQGFLFFCGSMSNLSPLPRSVICTFISLPLSLGSICKLSAMFLKLQYTDFPATSCQHEDS